MKDFINKKQIVICIGIVIAISIIAVAILQYNSGSTDDYSKYVKKTVLISLDDEKMYLDEGLFFAKNKQAYYEASYANEGYTLDWKQEYETGKTYEALVLEQSFEFTKKVFLFSEYAKAQGMTLTDAELSNVEASIDEFLSESTDSVLAATYANTDLLRKVYTRTAYYDKVCSMIYEDADITVTDEEARQCLVAAVEISPVYFSSPERTANKILERVNKGEIISDVASIYDTEAVTGNIGAGDMDGNALEKLCLSLKDGECGIAEIDGTFFVVYCYLANDEDATEISRENLLAEKQQAALDEFYEALEEEMSPSINEDAWKTITFDEALYE